MAVSAQTRLRAMSDSRCPVPGNFKASLFDGLRHRTVRVDILDVYAYSMCGAVEVAVIVKRRGGASDTACEDWIVPQDPLSRERFLAACALKRLELEA